MIDNYLRGELDADEMESLSKRLESDIALQKKVSLRKLIVAGINQSYAGELKSKLADFDRSLENKKRFHFSWKIAAVFAVFILAGVITYQQFTRTSPYDFDVADAGLPNEMGITKNVAFSNAMNRFKSSDFKAAGKSFDSLLLKTPQNDTLLYYSAICAFRNDKPEKAINTWQKVQAQSRFFEKTKYRLAVAHWALGDVNHARVIFTAISEDHRNPYQLYARHALRALP